MANNQIKYIPQKHTIHKYILTTSKRTSCYQRFKVKTHVLNVILTNTNHRTETFTHVIL